MSKRIIVLSEDIANKIAAGEVVERPASIVKELLENAIDAGATDIRVVLEKGGTQSIRVTDNGSGIDHDDVPLVFERHATSKIHQFEDIFNVVSFGFRGEAMPSIASVARVEMLTRRNNDVSGTRAILDGGVIRAMDPAGTPEGTQISVSGIFAHVPARRKFLKTEATEQGACLDVITRLALAHPEIRFKVEANGKEIFAAPEVHDTAKRIAMVMGGEFSAHCMAVDAQQDAMTLKGFISRPEYSKSNSKSIYLFVNKRFIRDTSLTHAVLSAYRQIIESRRYPAAALFLEVPPEDVDVNVHPAKMEVRFKNAHGVYELVSKTIAHHLSRAETSRGHYLYRLAPAEKKDYFHRQPFVNEPSPSMPSRPADRSHAQQGIQNILLHRSQVSQPLAASEGDAGVPDKTILFGDMRYVGQYDGTYLLFEGPDSLILLDQHAAHERIILEKLKKDSGKKAAGQSLLLPEIVNLTPGQMALLNDALDFLETIGLEIECFGRDAVAVKTVPTMLSKVKISEMIYDIVDQLADQNRTPSLQERSDNLLASLACKAAIKANRLLSRDEVDALCRELAETPFHATCPHGRPITIQFSLSEIERLFKRK